MTDTDDGPSAAEAVDNLIDIAAHHRKNLRGAVRREDFVAYLPAHNYIFMPTREPWPGSSVNAVLPAVKITKDKSIPASTWIDRHQAVEQMTWAPGEDELIRDRLISAGGWIERTGATCLNLYRPPTLASGNATKAEPWLDHVHKVFGEDDGGHIVTWLAQRVQQPQIKINHALVLGGPQGIGKDTLLEPLKRAVGPWNFSEVSPQHVLGRFNGFVKSVVLRVSEARDLGELNRYQFYDHLKIYTAAPPDVLRVDEKHIREHAVLNCCGVVITTNYKSDGIYLPPDDRRHYVAWSSITPDNFVDDYWTTLWDFYEHGGDRHVAAYLTELDISEFDPKAPPPKTAAFWDIVYANRAPEDAELADVLDRMGNPSATTLLRIADLAAGEVQIWINDRKNRRAIPHRLERCGYVPVRNADAADGLRKIHGKRQVIYAMAELPPRDRYAAAARLVAGE
jgi:Family of unknown function (DUF5906)